ncbi:phosphoglycerate mutase family protein, partial [Deinococcus metallilatus]
MSQLILVRHGQATPFEADTDRLSPLGEAQARAVGAYLAEAGLEPTDVICGSLVRQRESARLAAEAAGGGWPAPRIDSRLAEYDGDGLT